MNESICVSCAICISQCNLAKRYAALLTRVCLPFPPNFNHDTKIINISIGPAHHMVR